jgi:hypothetical protein
VSIRRSAAGWAYDALTIAARYPSTATFLARAGRYGHPLKRGTEIVIEGFPRSGNSFAVAAFRIAQGRPVAIGHHLHAPGHVIAAVKARIPVLVVIRDPGIAVPEFAASKPNLSLRRIAAGYVRFHEPLLPYRSAFVISNFEQVTIDFGAVIRRINERFSTSFGEFEASEANVRRAHQVIDREYRRREGSAPSILGSARGSSAGQREATRTRMREEYEPIREERLGREARRLYETLVGDR